MDTVPPASLAQVLAAGPKYAYPPATKPIVNNIATKLLEDPRFYINVLHLMNKMDLPPPFTVKNLAPQQPTMITASMRTIDLQKGSNVTPIARPKVEATVMMFVDSDRGGHQTSQGLGQQGQKRKQTDDLLASDESEVESEPDEEQERKAMVTKILKEGVMSPDSKGHANVAPKDLSPKPMADDTAQRTLDLEGTKETAQRVDNAPPADDFGEMTMGLPLSTKDSETMTTSGEKEESHELSKSQSKRMRKKQKIQEMGQRIESSAPTLFLSDAPQKETSTVPVVIVHPFQSAGLTTPDPLTTGPNSPSSKAPPPMSTAESILLVDLEALMVTKVSQDVEGVSDQAPKEANENIHILNLDFKKTSRSDLVNIFARYFDPNEAILEPNIFKYFTKGKLRNQAFIRMPSTDKATLAINQIHGCVVHDRRIVVQYGLQKASDKQKA